MTHQQVGYGTLLYNINSDTSKIAPTWGKVTATPWLVMHRYRGRVCWSAFDIAMCIYVTRRTQEARRMQGYGRHVLVSTWRLIKQSIINQPIMIPTIHYYQSTTTSKDAPLFIAKGSSGITERRPKEKLTCREESMAVMPGGLKTPVERLPGSKIVKLAYNKEVFWVFTEDIRN